MLSAARRGALAVSLAAATVAAGAAAALPAGDRAQVDELFAPYNHTDSPGCAVGIYRDGELAFARGYGMADLERGVPITSRTVFDIGSTSKQFTAASVALLASDGVLSLDDDVRTWLPELPGYASRITIRHLLHHTSGLRDYIGLLLYAGADIDDVTSAREALEIIVRQREPNFAPGSEHLYSNSGYFLASQIVERASGRSLRQFAAERIFGPLGMRQTLFRDRHDEPVPLRALAYEPAPTNAGAWVLAVSYWEQTGDGALHTSVEDLLLWDRNFYEPRIGDRALVETLQTPGRLASGETIDYALGLRVSDLGGRRAISHGGSWGGYRAELLRLPEERVSAAVLCNAGSADPSAAARQIARIVLADRLSPEDGIGQGPAARPAVLSEAELAAWAGTYRSRDDGEVRIFEVDQGRLVLRAFGERYELRPRDATTADLVEASWRASFLLVEPGGGAPRRIHESSPDEETDAADFEEIEVWRPASEELAACAGAFASDELLGAVFLLELAERTLAVRFPNRETASLEPLERDQFLGDGDIYRLQRDESGAVTGFLLDAGRIRNLRFERVTG